MTDKWRTHCAKQPVPVLPAEPMTNQESPTMTTKGKPASTSEELERQARVLLREAERLCGKGQHMANELLTAALTLEIVDYINREKFDGKPDIDERNNADIFIGDCLDNLAMQIDEVRKRTGKLRVNRRIRLRLERKGARP